MMPGEIILGPPPACEDFITLKVDQATGRSDLTAVRRHYFHPKTGEPLDRPMEEPIHLLAAISMMNTFTASWLMDRLREQAAAASGPVGLVKGPGA